MKSVVRWMLRATFSPPRCTYKVNDVVSVITLNSQIYYRTIFEFTSPKGENIMASIWRDHSNENPTKCMIYLHSLGANQFEAVNIIPAVCTKNLSVIAFDFPGCGLSGGEIMPLDGSGPQLVRSCVEYLTKNYHFTEFAIWGRSMGAAVALHTVSTYPDMFKCIVADSSFACTEKILKDQGRANGFPLFLVKMLMPIIKKEAKNDLKTNVDNPFPIEYVQNAKAPLLQGHGNKDRFVPCEHAKLIFDKYGGPDKQLNFFEGKHNSPRPNSWYETVCRFLYRHLNLDEKPKCYDYVYFSSRLHVGPVEQVLPEVLRVEEALKQKQMMKNMQMSLNRKPSAKINKEQNEQEDNESNEGNEDNENNQEYNNEYDNQNSYGSDNEYDYDYDENQENLENETREIENNQISPCNTTDKVPSTNSLLIPEELSQDKSGQVVKNKNNLSDSQIPIEESSFVRIKTHIQKQKETERPKTIEIYTEKQNKKNEKKIKEDKRKSHKVWFDSLSEIGTDIDLVEKIREEEKTRREMLNSINGVHHHRHHKQHHHQHIPLSSTKQSYATISSNNTKSSLDPDHKQIKWEENNVKINKSSSALMHELPLDAISDSEN